MVSELNYLYRDLDLGRLRVQRPSKFIFFCGGRLSSADKDACSMRHYLLNQRKIGKRLLADVLLAEKANQLYRDTDYHDLITFEEDIARISAMILVVAESAGSLAELGAFASNTTTRPTLTIIMQGEYAKAESFIRFGPVERIKKDDDSRVGFYPWKTNGRGNLIKSSARPHVREIIDFINAGVKRSPSSSLLSAAPEIQEFIIVYWVVYLSHAIPLGKLTSYISEILPTETTHSLRRKLYCMQLAGWIESISYSSTDYYFVTAAEDPFKYSFKSGVAVNDSVRRKTDVVTAIQRDLSLPRHVREVALRSRSTRRP